MASEKYTKLQQRDTDGRVFIDGLAAPDSSKFRDKSVIVTGGCSGLGEACVRMFVEASAWVVIFDRDEERGKALEAELGDKVIFCQLDVSLYQDQLLAFAKALEFFPSKELDILLTFAGVKGQDWSMNPVPNGGEVLLQYAKTRTDRSSIDTESQLPTQLQEPSTQCIDVALRGSLFSIHIAVKYSMGLDKPSRGPSTSTGNSSKSITLVSSIAGYHYLPSKPDYTASKFAIRGAFKCLRQSLPKISENGVRLNLLAPFFIETPMTTRLLPQLEKAGVKLGKMEDLSHAVGILATEQTINGRAIAVTAEGLRDLCDDSAGFEGGREIGELMKEGWLVIGPSATLS